MEHVHTTPGFEDGWDGYEYGYMQVSLSMEDETSPFIVAICDKFYLDKDTGVITLWKNISGVETVILQNEVYDTYSVDFLFEELKVIN